MRAPILLFLAASTILSASGGCASAAEEDGAVGAQASAEVGARCEYVCLMYMAQPISCSNPQRTVVDCGPPARALPFGRSWASIKEGATCRGASYCGNIQPPLDAVCGTSEVDPCPVSNGQATNLRVDGQLCAPEGHFRTGTGGNSCYQCQRSAGVPFAGEATPTGWHAVSMSNCRR